MYSTKNRPESQARRCRPMPSFDRSRKATVPWPRLLAKRLDPKRLRVAKTMAAGAPGTLKLLHSFGADLLVVRYRYDWTGLERYTTVELVVGRAPLPRPARQDRLYAVRLRRDERALAQELAQQGATLDRQLDCWIVPATVVQNLDLADRVELVPSSPAAP